VQTRTRGGTIQYAKPTYMHHACNSGIHRINLSLLATEEMHDMIWMASVMRTNIVLEVLASDEVETPPFPLHRRRNEVSPPSYLQSDKRRERDRPRLSLAEIGRGS
jgi:hypothetical protein